LRAWTGGILICVSHGHLRKLFFDAQEPTPLHRERIWTFERTIHVCGQAVNRRNLRSSPLMQPLSRFHGPTCSRRSVRKLVFIVLDSWELFWKPGPPSGMLLKLGSAAASHKRLRWQALTRVVGFDQANVCCATTVSENCSNEEKLLHITGLLFGSRSSGQTMSSCGPSGPVAHAFSRLL
jgi:hypothetical protein